LNSGSDQKSAEESDGDGPLADLGYVVVNLLIVRVELDDHSNGEQTDHNPTHHLHRSAIKKQNKRYIRLKKQDKIIESDKIIINNNLLRGVTFSNIPQPHTTKFGGCRLQKGM